MDNNMTAIVSAIMIALGFMNGMMVMSFIDATHSAKLKYILSKAIDQKFESDQLIDELQKQLADEKQEKDKLVEQLRGLVKTYERMAPPQGPLERSKCVCVSDSDSDDEFPNPASPDAQTNNTG